MDDTPENQLHDLIAAARRAGADAVEARADRSESTLVRVRLGKLETVERKEPEHWFLRVWVGARSASLASIDLGAKAARESLIERTLFMARSASEDRYGGLAPADVICSMSDEAEAALQLNDPIDVDPATFEPMARSAEAAALQVPGVANSSGGTAGSEAFQLWHLTSEGLVRRVRRTSFSASVSVVAGQGGAMETNGYGRATAWLTDLPSPEFIGAEGGRRAAAQLNARKIASTCAPVIFERRMSLGVLTPFLQAIAGRAVARGSSFLRHRLGERVFASDIRISDDPKVVRGMGSRLVDHEGVPTTSRLLVEDGVLCEWMLDVASARQLCRAPNGYASGPSNLTVAPGQSSLADLMSDAGEGLLVTSMFRPSLNQDTGDWSAGVSGVWFEQGAPAYPVSEITVAGSLLDFYDRMIPGADLEIEGSMNAPSLMVDAVAIGGL